MFDQRPVLSLKEALSHLPCPEGYTADDVSAKWRCRICPMATTEREMLHYFELGVPCFGRPEQSAPVHAKCRELGKHENSKGVKESLPPEMKYPFEGSYLNFVTNPNWAKFPSQKIAFHAGWAGPGTEHDAEKLHTMVDTWMDVLNSGGIDPKTGQENPTLNLQYFHRTDPTKDPAIPPLAALLDWPSFLSEKQGGRICDTATRVSKRGAVTWWHVDDSGEFVMQTGLPPTKEQRDLKQNPFALDAATNPMVTRNPLPPFDRGVETGFYQPPKADDETTSNSPDEVEKKEDPVVPVKLFIYVPPECYGWIMHDRETEDSGKITAMHLFRATDDQLPPQGYLPILNIAVLTAGGPPLVSCPNIPHMVISLNDCVMVEQRRVSDLYLDEVAYLLEKAKRSWGSLQPIMYYYLREMLRNGGHVQTEIVQRLTKRFNENYLKITERRKAENQKSEDELASEKQKQIEASDYLSQLPTEEELINDRIFASLHAVDSFPDHFRLTDNDRKRLSAKLAPEATDTSALAFYKHKTAEGEILIKRLEYHFDVLQEWIEPSQIFKLNERMCCAVVYDEMNSPIYGPPRPTKEQAKQDWHKIEDVQQKINSEFKADVKANGGVIPEKWKKRRVPTTTGSSSDGSASSPSSTTSGGSGSGVVASSSATSATRVLKPDVQVDDILDELF